MKKNYLLLIFVLLFTTSITGCLQLTGGQAITNSGYLNANAGIHVVEMQEGVTTEQLYSAVKAGLEMHNKDFEIKADDHGKNKSVVWTYSYKYQQPVTYYVSNIEGKVYLGVAIGESGQAKVTNAEIYVLQDIVTDNLDIKPSGRVANQ